MPKTSSTAAPQSCFLPGPTHELLLGSVFGPEPNRCWSQWIAATDLDEVTFASYRLLPLVVGAPRDAPLQDLPARVRGIYRFWWTRNQLRVRAAAEVVAVLRAHGVESLVFKGVAMAVEFYPTGCRPMADVDLAVHAEDVERAVGLLQEVGWKVVEAEDSVTAIHAITLESAAGIEVDLHWHFSGNVPVRRFAEDIWNQKRGVQVGDQPLWVPDLADQLLLTLIHGTQPSDNPSWHWIPDGLLLLRHPDTQKEGFWARFQTMSERYHLEAVNYHALEYLRRRWDAPIPTEVLSALAGAKLPATYQREYETRHRAPSSKTNLITLRAAHLRVKEHGTAQERVSLLNFLLRARNLRHGGEVPAFLWDKARAKLEARRRQPPEMERLELPVK